MNRKNAILTAALVFLAGLMPVLAEPAIPGRESGSERTGAWKEVSPAVRLAAIRVAQMDAMSQLAERVYGFQVNSSTTVYDLMLKNDRVKSQMEVLLRGAKELGERKYTDEGIVYVTYGVTLRQVMAIVEGEVKTENGKIVSADLARRLETEDIPIEALGNGAVPESRGARMIRAKRAAELDAFRQMAERVAGTHITRESTIRDLMLADDRIGASVTAYLRGLKPVKITYDDDDVCEVVMELTLRQVIEIVDRTVTEKKGGFRARTEVIEKVTTEVSDQVLTVTGMGAPRDEVPVAAQSVEAAVGSDSAYATERLVIKRVLNQGVVIE